MAFKFTRDFYIPDGYELIAKDERFGFEVHGKWGDRPVAVAFGGKRSKPDWHYSFKNDLALNDKIARTLAGFIAQEERKKLRAVERKKPHDVKVGDVFQCSWGYDQTNVDFYQVVELVGAQSCKIQKIAQHREVTGIDQGVCTPAKNNFIGDARVRRINNAYNEPSVRIYDFASAYRIKPILTVANSPIYATSGWSSYA